MRSPVVVVFIGLLAAGCGSTQGPSAPTPTSGPSRGAASTSPDRTTSTAPSRPSASQAIERTTPPAARPTPAEAPLAPRPESFVRVVTDDLRVRSKPEVSDQSVKYEPLLWKGALAWVTEGPVQGSGYDWYRIAPMGEADLQVHPDPPPPGWVAAASTDGEPWIADWGGCPSAPLDTASDMDWPPQGMIGLSCNGSRTIEFVAMASRWEAECEDGDRWLLIEPAWFRGCGDRYVLDGNGGFTQWERTPLFVALAPDAEVDVSRAIETGTWIRVRVTGHYDDPRARGCKLAERDGTVSEDPTDEGVVFSCRTQFVVTRLSDQRTG
jgi:hypothetical protein